ncbi:MAG: TetR/AcrR family transcriptional regulator [Candidatus Melainabacteria bacterium HGW-Melainabacteria-1]|nr:MAG: TetR/AcrR family transcriptional regulator [Candidatus Melainabacteria bacterium HGW-Melainabacteria-1]
MNKTNNRDQILIVALKLFAAQGYASVGVQEIVNAAGVSKPTLYHYFGNKQGLLAAVLAQGFEPALARLAAASVYQGDLVRSLTGLFSAWFELVAADPDWVALQLALGSMPRHQEIQQVAEPWLERLHMLLEGLFEAAVPQHGNLRGHQALLATALLGLLNQYALGLLAGRIQRSDDLVYKAVKQYMYGIYVL